MNKKQLEKEKIDEVEFNFASVIRASRKYMGINQKEASEYLGLTQSTYSKVERGVVSTGVENWLNFAMKLNINFDAPLLGIVELGKTPDYQTNFSTKEGWSVPLKYSVNRRVSSKVVKILINHLKENGHGKKINEFLDSRHIDPDFFIISHHTFSLALISDLAEYIGLTQEQYKLNKIHESRTLKKLAKIIAKKGKTAEGVQKYFSQESLDFDHLFKYSFQVAGAEITLNLNLRDPELENPDRQAIHITRHIISKLISTSLNEVSPNFSFILNQGE